MAHPAVLNDRYQTLSLLNPEAPQVRRQLEDVSYTLCVATGTSDIDAALIAARLRLPGARPHDDSAVLAWLARQFQARHTPGRARNPLCSRRLRAYALERSRNLHPLEVGAPGRARK